jgi:hypothetical protein
MANTARAGKVRNAVKRGPGKRMVEGSSFRLADEVRSIQRRAAEHDGRIVAVGQLLLFSTATGDAWLLDRSDLLAARLAHDGESEPVHIEDTDTAFTIGWTGRYRIDGPAFVYSDRQSGRVVTILGYPTGKLADTA